MFILQSLLYFYNSTTCILAGVLNVKMLNYLKISIPFLCYVVGHLT